MDTIVCGLTVDVRSIKYNIYVVVIQSSPTWYYFYSSKLVSNVLVQVNVDMLNVFGEGLAFRRSPNQSMKSVNDSSTDLLPVGTLSLRASVYSAQ